MIYRRRASPLHAARASAGSLYCLALASVALWIDHPVVIGALLAAILAAAACAGVGRTVARAVAWGLPFALLIAAINAIVVRDGVTVILRGVTLPAVGALDITLEGVAYGGVLGLRALVFFAAFALHSAAVDPDELLRAFRRVSFRSALTAALATRMLPVLARDARRMHDAQRCRAGAPAPRLTVVRAVATGVLDRAVDVAATLEVRGYGAARRPARERRPWSRHDIAFAAAAAALAVLAASGWGEGWDGFEAYPRLLVPVDATVLAAVAALALIALAPFADRRGVAR